ncbi:uncharacterized protein LOC107010416 [Solanum pennellii]|uniref:Uncharacterized protein LOC107010416 n=1 Tax=Solanum pennellii TaxID=28526 RepID=A0ABM1G2R8_SOLPN|nr:uncharacterized protein LOC107010416 [Solanum pennellii]
MDAFDFGTEKMENRVILIFHSFKSVAKLFRIVELCVGVFVVLWSSTRLPFVVKISGEYFRQLISIILSPLFIFLISNVIVLTLFFKSGRFSVDSSTISNNTETELYDSFIEKETCSGNFTAENSSPAPAREQTVYQDKQTILEVNAQTISESDGSEETETETEKDFCSQIPRRTKSAKFNRGSNKEIYGKLRRSETEMCRKIDNSVDPSETVYPVDELSNEEFQKAIEDFIARQIKFHQEEKLAIVLHS